MAEKISFKNCEDAYEVIKANLIVKGYLIHDPIKIAFGLQFDIEQNNQRYLVRLYNSKKKGTTFDPSQIKNKVIEKDVRLSLNIEDDGATESIFDEEDNNYKLYSLCVGINNFSNSDYNQLNFAENDADSLHKRISNKFGFGDGTHCLLDKNATKTKVIESLQKIAELSKPEDTVFIFVATHGDFLYNENKKPEFYLITSDSDSKDIIKTSIPLADLKEELSKIKAERKILFLDACFSGGIARNRAKGLRVPDYTKDIILKRFQSDEYIIITSSQASQTSWECNELKHGVFSYFLLNGLCGAIEFQKGLVDVGTLYTYLYQSVSNYVKEKVGRKQEPKFFGTFTGKFGLPLLIEIDEIKQEEINEKKKKFKFESIKCIGIDESGKGDYFGPLTVAAVYVDTEDKISKLISLGVRDSKSIPENKIPIIAKQIRDLCSHEVLHISPERYNQMWNNMANLNQVLAWSHAQCLEKVLGKNKDCGLAISDQFAAKEILLNKLKEFGKTIELIQRPKAEENIAVAAASILARDRFLGVMKAMSLRFKQIFPRGAGEQVVKAAAYYILKNKDLSQVAKLNFKTTKQAELLALELKKETINQQ